MNKKFIDILFVLFLISAPFKLANHIFWLPAFIANPFSHDFVTWPLIIGLVYTLYCQWKYKNVLYGWEKFKKYIIVYFAILLISLVQGLINYPYWEMLMNGQALNNAKFATAISFLGEMGIHVDQSSILPFWVFARLAKTIILNVLYTFGGAYMIFCWYHDRAERAISLLKNTTVGLLIVIAAYGVVDMCYQNGQWWAQNFISVMWPVLHTNADGSHYPMFLNIRNRSLFLEASYFAIYMAFAFPILWWKLAESKGKIRLGLILLYLILACEIYLGQSRTATALFGGELLLLTLVAIYKKRRQFLIFTVCLIAGAGVSFGGAMYFLQHYQVPAALGENVPLAQKKMTLIQSRQPQVKTHEQAAAYINDSVVSLVDKEKAEKRLDSNHVRFGITLANIEIGLAHPFFGVGPGLDTAYLYETFQNDQNGEIKKYFVEPIEKKGLLNSGSPVMCEYSAQFMQTGFLGLIVFILPMGYILVCFLRRLFRKIEDEREFYLVLFVTLSDIGISVTGLGNTVNITYCYWLMIGVSFVIELGLRKHEQNILR
ncbi:O-antigen ligase family protein [Megasphaera massiliensis]|uniref:O-antigen ligase family protein n=1 Tax=Megasphaera massiliensis TaxID=1232428 RepID=UPI00210DE651|nr:O-antigen ligase family protein [Megasphaera massiliensis]MCQ5209798.1 O-antigen ligase family protein [Megasphaera massiliensis]